MHVLMIYVNSFDITFLLYPHSQVELNVPRPGVIRWCVPLRELSVSPSDVILVARRNQRAEVQLGHKFSAASGHLRRKFSKRIKYSSKVNHIPWYSIFSVYFLHRIEDVATVKYQ